MARALLLFAALATCLVLGVGARPLDSQLAVGSPAFAANLHQSGVQKLVDIVLPMLVAKIRGIHIPDVSGKQSSFNYDITSIIIQQVSYGSAPVSLQTNVNFALQNLYVHVTLNWKYKESIWPHVPFGSGSADVTISESGGQVAISAAEVGGKPVLHVDSVAVSLNKLDIKIHGSIFSWLYDIIIGLFKGAIKTAIQNAVRDQLSSVIQNQVNAMIAAFSFHIQMTDRMLMNWELTSAPTFPGDGSMLVYLNGGFEEQKPTKVAPLPHSALKTDRSGRMIDIVIDQFLPDSAFWAMWDLGYLQKFVRPQDIDPSSPIQLNTAYFKLIFPALFNAYPNRNMQLLFYSTAPPTITLTSPGGAAVDALTNVIVFADSNGAGAYAQAFTLSSLLHLDMTANITGQRLAMNFPDIHFILGLVNSTIGPFDVTIMDVLIDIALNKVLLPSINDIANKGVPLPSIDGLTFVNAFINFAAGYMNIGTDLNYRPPSLTMPPPTEWELTRHQFPTANAINLNDEL